ncbi:MAG: MFS transporter, partial [Actinobacteria bacterium]|nr:MFS transporter [Actinomycetota bacterium]
YGTGTLVATCSLNAWMLLVGWAVLEGIGAALMLPATTTLVSAEYEGKDRVIAFGIWGGIAATGAAIGPIVGGLFTTYLSWRLVFGSEIIVVAGILLLRSRLSESHPDLSWKDLDKTGALLSIVSLLLFVFGVLILRSPGRWPLVPLLTIPGIVLFVVFLWLQGRRVRKGLEPLFDISILGSRMFNIGNITSVIQQLSLAGALFVIPVFLQQVTGTSAFLTGVALLPLSLSIFVFSLGGGKLLVLFRQEKYVVMTGFAVSAAGFFIMNNDFSTRTAIPDLIPGLLILGSGVGLLLSQLTNVTMSAASDEQGAGASGFLNTSKNLGYALGTALIGVLLVIGVFGGLVTSLSTSNLPQAAGMSTEEVRKSLMESLQEMQTEKPSGVPVRDVPEATDLLDAAISSGMKLAFNVMAVLMLLGLVTAVFMPRTKSGP